MSGLTRTQLFVRFYDYLQSKPIYRPEAGRTDFNRLNKASLRVLNSLAAENQRLWGFVRAFLTAYPCDCGDTEHCITCMASAARRGQLACSEH